GMVRVTKPTSLFDRRTWHKHVPFKWSYTLWRALRNKLPTKRCAAKYGSKQSNLLRVKFGITSVIYKLLKITYPYFIWIHDLPIHIRELLMTDKLGLANL
ncbi:hypothetical protein H5410_027619, partial [Solanum commersonii]